MSGRAALFLGLAAILVWWAWSGRVVHRPPGVVVAEAPIQLPVENAPHLVREGFRIEPLAQFEVRARVLSTERYYFGRSAELSPEDLALGWGRMSDTTFIDQLNISQSSRFYMYSWANQPPLPVGEIINNSANMHIIPADDVVARALRRVRTGQIVRLKGYLVRIDTTDGWRWVSSTTRSDSGAGACEVVWTESIESED